MRGIEGGPTRAMQLDQRRGVVIHLLLEVFIVHLHQGARGQFHGQRE